jgi:hypothetical protein
MKWRRHRPAQSLFGQADLLHTERFSVSCCGILFMGAAEADVGANQNQGWPAAFFLCSCQCKGHRIDIVALFDSLDVPAESRETRHPVFGKASSVLPSIVMWLLA